MGVNSERKLFAHPGAKSFLLDKILFGRVSSSMETNRKTLTFLSFLNIDEKHECVANLLSILQFVFLLSE